MKSSNAPRPDLFTPIHKALRRSLYLTAVDLGGTDFADAGAVARAHVAVDACLGFLREHAEHEDHHVLPRIAALAPALAEQLATEHPALERAAIEVDVLWPRLAMATVSGPAEVVDHEVTCHGLGAELARRFQALVAAQLRHMEREEREVNALFWAHLTDVQLGEMQQAILADIPAARAAEWFALLGPAINRVEREAMARAA